MPARSDEEEVLALEVEELELLAELGSLRADIDAGLIPPDARRPLFPHEILARTNFAALEGDLNRAAEEVQRLLLEFRDEDLTALEGLLRAALERGGADPRARLGGLVRAADDAVMRGLGLAGGKVDIPGRTERMAGVLRGSAEAGIVRVRAEALAQGVKVGDVPRLTPNAEENIRAQARRVAFASHNKLSQAARDRVYALPIYAPPGTPGALTEDEVLEEMMTAARDTSTGELRDVARRSSGDIYSTGRDVGAAALPRPARIYASALLDRNTCPACYGVDGKEYASVEDSLEDFPAGRYVNCDGGERCRCTRVFVWPDEAPPTSGSPGDTAPPKPGEPGGPPLPGQVTPGQEHLEGRPKLRTLGDKLKVESDHRAPTTARHLDELERAPVEVLKAVTDHVTGVHVGERFVPELDEMGRLKGVQPRGYARGRTWDDVGGAYTPRERKVLVGNDVNSGSISTALHELGHGYDDALTTASRTLTGGGSRSPAFLGIHRKVVKKWANPYYTQAGTAGPSELFAESFAAHVKGRRDKIERLLGVHRFDTPETTRKKLRKVADELVAFFEDLGIPYGGSSPR